MKIQVLLFALGLWLTQAVQAESAQGILPQSLVTSLRAKELFEYRCPRNINCRIRCTAIEEFDYQNVKIAEIARSDKHWLFGIVHMDSLGIAHKAIGFLPEPTSCILDDLEFSTSIPLVDGRFNRGTEDVIFDVTPSN